MVRYTYFDVNLHILGVPEQITRGTHILSFPQLQSSLAPKLQLIEAAQAQAAPEPTCSHEDISPTHLQHEDLPNITSPPPVAPAPQKRSPLRDMQRVCQDTENCSR